MTETHYATGATRKTTPDIHGNLVLLEEAVALLDGLAACADERAIVRAHLDDRGREVRERVLVRKVAETAILALYALASEIDAYELAAPDVVQRIRDTWSRRHDAAGLPKCPDCGGRHG